MARKATAQDQSTLKMALVGYELEKQKIEEKIQEILAHLGRKRGSTGSGTPLGKQGGAGNRVLSEAARKRIGMAQKKRWAEHRKKAALARRTQGK